MANTGTQPGWHSGTTGEDTQTPRTRPVQVAGEYPVRQVTWYQINNSDLRSIGIAQAVSTFFAAIGTFMLSLYIEFSKDIALNESADQPVPDFLQSVTSFVYWGWLAFWGVAIISFLWQGLEIRRIKREHGDTSLWQKCQSYWKY